MISHLPWLIQTRFQIPRKSFDSSKKQIFKDILEKFSDLIIKLYVMGSLEPPHRDNSNEYAKHSIILCYM